MAGTGGADGAEPPPQVPLRLHTFDLDQFRSPHPQAGGLPDYALTARRSVCRLFRVDIAAAVAGHPVTKIHHGPSRAAQSNRITQLFRSLSDRAKQATPFQRHQILSVLVGLGGTGVAATLAVEA
jgi:hypothetical protein